MVIPLQVNDVASSVPDPRIFRETPQNKKTGPKIERKPDFLTIAGGDSYAGK